MGTAREERWIVGLWRKLKRLAIQVSECSWFGEPRWWRGLGRSEVRERREEMVSTAAKKGLAAEVSEVLRALKLRGILTWLVLSALVVSLAACSKSAEPSIRTFASPDDAANALIAVAKSGDQAAITAIFGTESKELISSG